MSDDGNDLSAIAWPGFVDILSAVIIMFVFFVMVVATALYFHIIIFKSQILASPESSQVKIESEVKAVIAQVQTQFAESNEQNIDVQTENNVVTVFFGGDSISLTKNSLDQVKAYIENYTAQKDISNIKVKVTASKNPNTLQTAARKIALARMLNVRNAMLQSGFSGDAIKAQVIEGEPIQETLHWVQIEIIE